MKQSSQRSTTAPHCDSSRTNRAHKGLPQITAEARRYALKELARRAGVSKEFHEKWAIEVLAECTRVSFGDEHTGCIEFIHERENNGGGELASAISIAKAGWLAEPEAGFEGELVLPFCNSEDGPGRPLYYSEGAGKVVCRMDLLAAMVLTLSRTEESLGEEFDEHGRFPAKASAAARHGYLERPILDEHGAAFGQALSYLMPGWRPQERRLRVKLTHDIDELGIPFDLRSAMGHSVKRRKPIATAKAFVSTFSRVEPIELGLVRELAKISEARGLHSAFYWKACERGPHDSGYDPTNEKVQNVLKVLRNSNFELGVHPGYETFRDRRRLVSEVEYLRQALRVRTAGGRQHYLRWTPETWLDWEACGLAYDSSVGFADAIGFRAGTAIPYRPWSFQHNREINLVEIPLILMDCTPVSYMKLRHAEALERIRTIIQRIARTGGVFTLLWHNTPLMEPEYAGWYEAILDLIAGAHSLGAVNSAEEIW